VLVASAEAECTSACFRNDVRPPNIPLLSTTYATRKLSTLENGSPPSGSKLRRMKTVAESETRSTRLLVFKRSILGLTFSNRFDDCTGDVSTNEVLEGV